VAWRHAAEKVRRPGGVATSKERLLLRRREGEAAGGDTESMKETLLS
jgi:hypothetical protein